MKILEFHKRIKKTMKSYNFTRDSRKLENLRIPVENHKNHKNILVPYENRENYENLEIHTRA